MKQVLNRRVVITGVGVVAANGVGKQEFWDATCNGVSGIRHIQGFSTDNLSIQVAGEVDKLVVQDHMPRKLINRTDRMTHLVLPAVKEALQDANICIENEEPGRVGTVIANTLGGINFGGREVVSLYTNGLRSMSAYTAIAWLQVANVGQTAIQFGANGYSKTPVNDTVGGLDALTIAYRAIQRGDAEIIIAGGSEAMLYDMLLFLLEHCDSFATGDDPAAYRPFDRRASGLVLGEGAGICILEEYEHAIQRGATIYGEFAGYAQTNDAHGQLPPSSDGRQYGRAIYDAMKFSGLSPKDIAYFSLDGRALPYSDAGEVEALNLTFGSDLAQLPVSVPRTMLGHTYAAAGALDAVTAMLALKHRVVPPTINCEQLDERYGFRMVRGAAQSISSQAPAVLLGGRAVGGANVVVALKHYSD